MNNSRNTKPNGGRAGGACPVSRPISGRVPQVLLAEAIGSVLPSRRKRQPRPYFGNLSVFAAAGWEPTSEAFASRGPSSTADRQWLERRSFPDPTELLLGWIR